jgi:hypothetical protein
MINIWIKKWESWGCSIFEHTDHVLNEIWTSYSHWDRCISRWRPSFEWNLVVEWYSRSIHFPLKIFPCLNNLLEWKFLIFSIQKLMDRLKNLMTKLFSLNQSKSLEEFGTFKHLKSMIHFFVAALINLLKWALINQ